MGQTSLQNVETQHQGIVGIIFNTGKNPTVLDFDVLQRTRRIRSGMPVRMSGFHYCFDNLSIKPFVMGMQLLLDKETRQRFRVHFDNLNEIVFELQTYGLHVRDFPIQSDGTISLDWHKEWIKARQYQEKHMDAARRIVLPRPFDVLFGRGSAAREHTGNLRAVHLVTMHQAEYEEANRVEKTLIARRIVDIIHKSYGRFLRWEEGGWVEVESEECHHKISHFFRHLRSKRLEIPDMEKSRGSKRKTAHSLPLL